MKKYLAALLISVLLFSCSTDGPPAGTAYKFQDQAFSTAYTSRIPAPDYELQAIALTNIVYPATRTDNAVGAIILSLPDPYLAFTAMQRITHMPVNAPLLYLNKKGEISEDVMKEMKRLAADGVFQDGNKQVYIVGHIDKKELLKISELLKYKYRHFNESNPVRLAELLDRWQAALKSDHPDEVIVSSYDHPEGLKYGIGAMGWNAHMGRGFAWVYRDSVPNETREILKRRLGGSYIYLTGNSDIISDKVAMELGRYGLVRRISGNDAYSANTTNAGYKDYGRNFGWWIEWEPRFFGWGIAQAGHNFIIGNADDMLGLIPAVVLGHMGKHGPVLIIDKDSIPLSVNIYLTMVKPFPTSSQESIFNFGWIIGDSSKISVKTQKELDHLLSPFKEDSTFQLTSKPE